MSKQSDPTTLVDGVLAAAAHLEPELEEALAEHHLSRPSFQVLSALLDAEGHALTQRELMAQVRRTSGTMSVRLARLERAGLVTREPDAEDRRSVTRHADRQRARARRGRAPGLRRRRRSASPPACPTTRARPSPSSSTAWLGFFEPDDGVAPRLGVAVGPRRGRLAHAPRGRPARPPRHPRPEGQALERGRRAPGLARGDLVTGAGGAEVRTIGDLHRAVRHARGTLALDVVRGVEERSVEVALSRSS